MSALQIWDQRSTFAPPNTNTLMCNNIIPIHYPPVMVIIANTRSSICCLWVIVHNGKYLKMLSNTQTVTREMYIIMKYYIYLFLHH